MKKYFLFAVILFSCSAFQVHAQFVFTEIMYDLPGTDTDHEWVEIQNTGATDADVTDWKFNDGSNHNLNTPPTNGSQGSFTIPVGEYAILTADAVKFLSDYSGYAGTVIDTVMSLNNTTDTLKLIDKNGIEIDSVTYDSSIGASGDGNTIQKSSSSWIASSPTVGISYSVSSQGGGTGTQGVTSGTTSVTSPSIPMTAKDDGTPKITADIILKNTPITGVDAIFDAAVIGYSKEKITRGKFVWNFGDGVTEETSEIKKMEHIYDYPGDYVVMLEYYPNSYSTDPDATDRLVISVLKQQVIISSIGFDANPYVEISNTGTHEIDLSRFILRASSGAQFVFPKNTIVLGNKKIILSPKMTHFTADDVKTATLLYPSGEVAFAYESALEKIEKQPREQVQDEKIIQVEDATKSIIATNNEEVKSSSILNSSISPENLQANAFNALPESTSSSFGLWAFGLIVLMALAGGAVVFLRFNYSKVQSKADDFEILE
ncbi:MAG: lamin tail domain-containing protein [Candidatus Paceibacterota bacterium]|jgi:hypothetical protein